MAAAGGDPQAKQALKEEAKTSHGPRAHLVQLGLATDVAVGAGASSDAH